jgi:pyruvate,orthophosphate dikinase
MILFRGIGASPGRATGAVIFSPDAAREDAVLFRTETSADDTPAIRVCAAVVTTRGGITADAAIVARTLGKPCVVSCASARIDYSARAMYFVIDGVEHTLCEGDRVTVDGAAGTVESA